MELMVEISLPFLPGIGWSSGLSGKVELIDFNLDRESDPMSDDGPPLVTKTGDDPRIRRDGYGEQSPDKRPDMLKLNVPELRKTAAKALATAIREARPGTTSGIHHFDGRHPTSRPAGTW